MKFLNFLKTNKFYIVSIALVYFALGIILYKFLNAENFIFFSILLNLCFIIKNILLYLFYYNKESFLISAFFDFMLFYQLGNLYFSYLNGYGKIFSFLYILIYGTFFGYVAMRYKD